MGKRRCSYRVGHEEIECLIEKLTGLTAPEGTQHLLQEIFTTAVKLGRETEDMGDLKLVNNELKELRYSFKIFAPYRHIKKVVIFGSARSKPSSPEYRMAEAFSRALTERGYMIVTGAGAGIMEGGNKGAKPGSQFGLNIRLPFEQKPNPYINVKERLINYKYFFTRKLIFIKETDATALFPGGFGTHDEGFEMLTLIQTGKSKPRPIVLLEPEGSTYWTSWKRYVKEHLLKTGYIEKQDLKLFHLTHSVNHAVRIIEEFYRVYHSIRYISGKTVIRLNRNISDRALALLNRRFRDILTEGEIRRSGPLKAETARGEFLDLPRLVMHYNQRDYGRLCEMIHAINADKIPRRERA